MDGPRGGAGGLQISVEQPSEGVVIVAPNGELDMSNAEVLDEAIVFVHHFNVVLLGKCPPQVEPLRRWSLVPPFVLFYSSFEGFALLGEFLAKVVAADGFV